MQAITITEDQQLRWQDHPQQPVAEGQVRIAIAATAVNRADLMQKVGLYPPPPGYSNIPGLECAGEVLEVGPGVSHLEAGMTVCALLAAGGYASEVVCDAGQVLPVPAGFSVAQAAAIPEVFATAWLNLYGLAEAQPGERILLKAGGSGVGTAAIQLCKAFGNPVWVQVGDDDKLARCVELGAEGGINRHRQALADLKPHGPFDVVLDPVAGPSIADTLPLMNSDGRLVVIGLMGGTKTELDVGRLLVKRLEILGSTLRPQPIETKTMVMQALFEQVWPLFESGQVQPVIERVMSIQQLDEAYALLESNQTFGKIVLTIDG